MYLLHVKYRIKKPAPSYLYRSQTLYKNLPTFTDSRKKIMKQSHDTTPEQRKANDAARKRQQRAQETPEEHRGRLEHMRSVAGERRRSETPDEREERLERMRSVAGERRRSETPDER